MLGLSLGVGLILLLVIFALDRFDHKKKMLDLEKMLVGMEEVNSAEYKDLFLNFDTDTLREMQVEKVLDFFAKIQNDERCANISQYGSRIVWRIDTEYRSMSRRDLTTFRNYYQDALKLIKRREPSEKEADYLRRREQSDTDTKKFILENFSFAENSKIIYPIVENSEKSVWFIFDYLENH